MTFIIAHFKIMIFMFYLFIAEILKICDSSQMLGHMASDSP